MSGHLSGLSQDSRQTLGGSWEVKDCPKFQEDQAIHQCSQLKDQYLTAPNKNCFSDLMPWLLIISHRALDGIGYRPQQPLEG